MSNDINIIFMIFNTKWELKNLRLYEKLVELMLI